jgi:cation diffusion facilitator CzcD-associated flavoprotein CzcO
MPDTHALAARPSQGQLAVYDAIVIGAGISGMYMLYRLRQLGMTARVFETGTNVGGTWYWNRYPGARFDSESWTYGYSFSKELMSEWDWKEHFSPQPDTLEYLNYVADKFDLRRDIQFRSTVATAHWDEAANRWNVTLESGEQATARFLFTAIGILSAYTLPAIPGRDSFKGPAYHLHGGRTHRWISPASAWASSAPVRPPSRRFRKSPNRRSTLLFSNAAPTGQRPCIIPR